MILHSLTATFGCLNNSTLELQDGLNVIQAPNESGKSTWLAFLRAMLYGLSSRERGPLADKNRYAPWNGAAMKGRIDLNDGAHDLVIVRDTVQGGTPMGRFYAAYDSTATQVEGMTGQNAGELLTGVPKSVFERSAFIRQSALAVDQSAELEKRISSLISSGEEDTSYIETEKMLRAALNHRRYNKSGTLPQTETAIEETAARLEHIQTLRRQSETDRIALEDAEQLLSDCSEKLALHDRMDRIDAKRALFAARAQLQQAEHDAEGLRAEIEQSKIPPAEQLMHIKFNAANLLTTQVSMNHVQTQAEEAKKQTAAAQSAVDRCCFAPAEPESAAEKVRGDAEQYRALMQHAAPGIPLIALLTALFAALLGAGAYYLQQNYLPDLWTSPALAGFGLAAAAVPVILGLLRRSSRRRAQREAKALLTQYGVETPEEIEPLLIHYNKVYNALMAQKDAEAQINASWQNFFQTYKKLSAEILEDTSSFCPDIENVHEVSSFLDEGLRKWKRLQSLANQAAQLQARCDALRGQLPDDAPLTAEEEALQRPAERRDSLQAQQHTHQTLCAELRTRIDRAAGEADAIGDVAVLRAQLEELESKRDAVQSEYDAIALAMEALGEANHELQTRFSPALGKRAGEIFESMTGGRYHNVLLDAQLHASAEGDDAVPREAALLSQGASDQLYLAVRLAICEQVLPADKNVPLILDDTLVSFDEERMAAALAWLRQEAAHRQILLFTCQTREADFLKTRYLQDPENVHIISLYENRRH